jgi:6-phosphogluconolactonase (cycloisomerase 2 family)
MRNLIKTVESRAIRGEPGSGVRVIYLHPNVKVLYFKPSLEMKADNR